MTLNHRGSIAVPLDDHDSAESAAPNIDGVFRTTTLSGGGCGSWCCMFLRFVNHFTMALLVAAVIFLILQVQYLSKGLTQQEEELESLELRLQNQTTTQIQVLSEKVDQEQNLTLFQMAGTFAMFASILTFFHMSSHLRRFCQPIVQRKIVAILWLSPVYAITSFFSLVFPSADGYLAVIKDFYEAYAIFVFLSFLIAVLGRGDRQLAAQILSHHADHLKKPTWCLRSCYHPPPETSATALANAVVTECQILTMQFVFVRPITSIATFVTNTFLEQDPHYSTSSSFSSSAVDFFKSPSFFIDMVTNVSVFLAFTGLLKFYHAVREDLQWCQPLYKFLTIKGLVFLTFWQGLAIYIIVALWYKEDATTSHAGIAAASGNLTHGIQYEVNANASSAMHNNDNLTSAKQHAAQIQNFLICLEMLFFSIAHWCVFPAEEWEPDYRPQHYAKPGIGLQDFVSDMSYIISSRSEALRAARSSNDEEECLEGSEVEMAEHFDADLALDDDDDYDHDKTVQRNVDTALTGLDEPATTEAQAPGRISRRYSDEENSLI